MPAVQRSSSRRAVRHGAIPTAVFGSTIGTVAGAAVILFAAGLTAFLMLSPFLGAILWAVALVVGGASIGWSIGLRNPD